LTPCFRVWRFDKTNALEHPRNPFHDPDRRPDWAQLTRLGGDRAAILFEQLRAQVADIGGLVEGLHYGGPELGWTPRYMLGATTLFTAHIFPGRLEASIDLDVAACEKILASPQTGAGLKAALRQAQRAGKSTTVRMPISTLADVRAFAREVRRKGKIVATPQSQQTPGH
jgi:hypothetical protein